MPLLQVISVTLLPLVTVPTPLAHLNHSFLNAIALSHSLDSIAKPFVVICSALAINATTSLNANSAATVVEVESALLLDLVVLLVLIHLPAHPVLLVQTVELALVELALANLVLEVPTAIKL